MDWALGRVLLEKVLKPVLYALLPDRVDPRDWMRAELLDHARLSGSLESPEGKLADYWFDVVSDTGDSDVGAYSLSYLLHGDLTVDDPELLRANHPTVAGRPKVFAPSSGVPPALPRGNFLYVGGDTAYPVADTSLIQQRFTQPMNDAFTERFRDREKPPARPLLAIPGNHDWYDNVDGFNRTFRKAPEPPSLPGSESTPPTTPDGYLTAQEASYFALGLPGGWGFWAVDARDGADVDYRQRCYFAEAPLPTRLLLATPSPPFVNGYSADWVVDFWNRRLPPEARSRLALWFSGDVHHYARFEKVELGAEPPFTSVVSGLGSAALHAPLPAEISANMTFPAIADGERAVLRRLTNPPYMLTRWGLTLLGAVLGLVLGTGATQARGEASSLIGVLVPSWAPSRPEPPILLAILAVTLAAVGVILWSKLRRRESREREARQTSGKQRIVSAAWPIVLMAAAVTVVAHHRASSFGSVASDLAFHLVALVLLIAFPVLYAWNVAENRRSLFFYVTSGGLALVLGLVVTAGSVSAAHLAASSSWGAPALVAAVLQTVTFSSLAGLVFALGFKLGTHRMASSSFAAVDQYLAFIRFRLRVDTTGKSSLTGFVIAVTQPVARKILNGERSSRESLVPQAELIDVFTVE